MGIEQTKIDEYWMGLALEQAQKANDSSEVPVGAVLIKKNKLISSGFNLTISNLDPTAHAEIVVIRQAASKLNNYRLLDTTLYVTLEPCAMCAGAIINSRILRVVYGAAEPKTGCCESILELFNNPKLNHHASLTGGIMQEQCSDIISKFFKNKREKLKKEIIYD